MFGRLGVELWAQARQFRRGFTPEIRVCLVIRENRAEVVNRSRAVRITERGEPRPSTSAVKPQRSGMVDYAQEGENYLVLIVRSEVGQRPGSPQVAVRTNRMIGEHHAE
jgi:hypothetical protein